jgi:thioredoxin 1
MDIRADQIDQLISEHPAVIVDLWAPWCGPCRAVSPVLESIVEENPNVFLAKVNVDDNPEVMERFGVRGIPTILVYSDGELAKTVIGAKPKQAMELELAVILEN